MAGLLRSKRPSEPLEVKYTSFNAVQKVLEKVVERLLKNEDLKKLLFYSDKNALGLPNLTVEQTISLVGEQIRLVPKLKIDEDTKPYIIISLDRFSPSDERSIYRNMIISFDIFSDYEYWDLGDFRLRPYLIAGEIDGMVNKAYFEKGIAEFLGAKQLVLNEHLGGLSMSYLFQALKEDIETQIIPPSETTEFLKLQE